MADSARTPLLRQRSSRASASFEDATPCLFDRITPPFLWLFTGHNLAIASGPLATIFIFVFTKYHGFHVHDTTPNKIGPMLGALVWIALWWMLEAVPIAVTSLLPLVLFPFFGIMGSDAVAAEYTNDTVVLMLGTFILALAIERYGLHKRMALKIMLVSGGEKMDPRLVMLGFIIGPAFVSMWMSNSSAAVMMIPVASGVLKNLKPEAHVAPSRTKSSSSLTIEQAAEEGRGAAEAEKQKLNSDGEEDEEVDAKLVIHRFSQGVILAVTYGTALGGMATLIGCGPNLVLPGIYRERFPRAPELSFLQWMKFAMVLVVPWIVVLWVFLCWCYSPPSAVPVIGASLNRNMVEKDYKSFGPISFAEMFVFTEFCILVLLWITRSFGQTPGWGEVFGYLPNDGTVAVAAAILLFVVPDFRKEGQMLMDWKTCKNISWSVILVLGGGFSLSKGFKESGLSTWIGLNMELFELVPYYLLTPVLATIISIVTEFSSNAATATLFLPIFAEVAISINMHPLLLMVPATFASNYAFLLPSGTPPNAIAIGTGYLTVQDMAGPGLFMHVVGIVILSILTPTLGAYVFGLDQPANSLPWIIP